MISSQCIPGSREKAAIGGAFVTIDKNKDKIKFRNPLEKSGIKIICIRVDLF